MSAAGSDLFGKTLSSLFWQFLGVGGQRIVQLLSYAALWRLLTNTDDLGLFMILLSGIGVIESLTVFVGEQASIWSDRGAERRYLDTVFTVRALRGVLITLILVPLAWPFAWYFGDPETEARYWLPGLFLVLALNGLIDAVQSPARAARMKGLDFRRVALGDFVAACLGSGLTLLYAWIWRDVWALVLGHLTATAVRSFVSYVVAPHWPRPNFDRDTLKELFHYNVGAAGTPFLLVMIFSSAPLVVGKVISKGAVAVYEGATRLAKLPEEIFLRVLAPVATPAYAQVKNDPARLARAWKGAVRAFVLVGAPMTITLAWCGDALPSVIWGEAYVAVPGLFALLAVHGGLAGLTSVVGPLFWALGKPKFDRSTQFYRAITIYAAGVPLTIWFGVLGFASAACLAILVGLCYAIARALPMLGLHTRDLLETARGGTLTGASLLFGLLAIDLTIAPDGWWRIGTAALVSGPLLGYLMLRLLKSRRSGPPTGKAPDAKPDAEPARDAAGVDGPALPTDLLTSGGPSPQEPAATAAPTAGPETAR
ncbi:MAG: oligosaccharide flippase family protein [bacterium]|nr:oligosaccharide flippase family protein [bacterium]